MQKMKNKEEKKLNTKEQEKQEEQEEKEVDAQEEKPSEESKLEQQISFLKAENTKLKEEANNWKNKYYQAFADLANTRKSLEKDHETFIKYRAQGFIEKILPTLDSFEMASKAKVENPEFEKFAQGYKMIHTQLEQALTEEGIEFLEPKIGSDFDASYMHAVQTAEGEEDNKVVAIFVKGYKLHDRLIRPAMVVVSKKKEEKKD